ncbi:MAG: DUF6320 domain-containing protein [Sphaerochaetaceae bacterium]|jgi:hypothetical protein|nr:DUF6320 domain-containing protein [Sphaerochaetaceae bacterium]NLY08189.1 zinc ribbon domain-containing protein [Spirochaetales bacterium]
MAYCVKCGVQLPDGSKSCPLCGTSVILPPGMEEQKEKPLFPESSEGHSERGLDKTRKAMFEIAMIITVVAEIVVGFSMLPNPDAFIPMLCIAYAAIAFLIPVLVEKPSYTVIASMEIVATAILVLLIELFLSKELSWSLIVAASLALTWVLTVVPILLRRHIVMAVLIMIAGLCGFLALIDVMFPPFGWVIKVGYPTFAFMLVSCLMFLLRLKSKIFVKATTVDLVFSFFSIVCMTIGFGDWAYHGFASLGWSRSLWVCGITLFVIEILIAFTKKLRNLFNTRNAPKPKNK